MTTVDTENSWMLFKILTLTQGIPVILLAIWSEYTQSDLRERMQSSEFDRNQELSTVQILSIVATALQVLNFLAHTEARQAYPLLSLVTLGIALMAQTKIQAGLEKKLRHPIESIRAKTPFDLKPMLWITGTILSYFSTVIASIALCLTLSNIFALGKGGTALLGVFGACAGILIGMGLHYGLAALHIRKLMPTRSLDNATILSQIEAAFARAGINTPPSWLIDFENSKVANAFVAGFSGGKDLFESGVFLTHAMIQQTTRQELDAVLLHEVSHIALNHLRKRLIFGFVTIVGASFLAALTIVSSSVIASRTGMPGTVLSLIHAISATGGFLTSFIAIRRQSRRQEIEADVYAVSQLGADPQAMESVLKKLDQLSGVPASSVGASHPDLEERLQAIRGCARTDDFKIAA